MPFSIRRPCLLLTAVVCIAVVSGEVETFPRDLQPSRASAPQTQKGTARIRGIVVAADTGMPIRRAQVRLNSPGVGSWTTTTDANGTFEFPFLPAAHFVLTATKAGFVTMALGQKHPSDPGRPTFVLGEGQVTDDARISLPRGGVVTGRVVDEFGDPVVDATVQAFQSEYMQGFRRIRAVRGVTSNDIGQFRLYGLAPGRYYIAATLRASDTFPAGPSSQPTEVMRGGSGFAPTFFPGTAVAADAQPLTVTAGAEMTGIDFGLLAVRLARISGTVVDSRGTPAPKHAVMLNNARSDRAMISNINIDETKADGRFTLQNVTPGEYRIDVRPSAEFEAIAKTGRGVGRSQHDGAGEFASMPITISGEDVEGSVVRTTAGHRLSGTLVVEGGSLTPQALQAIQVNAYDVHAGAGVSALMLSAGGSVQPDGTFEVRGVADRRLIRVSRLPPGWTLKAVRAHGTDVTDSGVDFPNADVAGVEIVVTARPTEVLGTITDARGTAIGDRTVIIFPDDRDRWTAKMNRYVTSVRASANGTFKVSALPPATYLAAVVEYAPDGEWAEPENLERLRTAATKFVLADGETKTVTLRVNP